MSAADGAALDAIEATAEAMCRIFTVGPRGTHWRIDDVSVRAVQAAIPTLVAALRAEREEVKRLQERHEPTREQMAAVAARLSDLMADADDDPIDALTAERDAAIARAEAAEAAIAAVRALPLRSTSGIVRNYVSGDDLRRALDTGATT